ncbi:MAG TPA: hypothetical protein VGG04_10320 [Candidatus Sulfotelmatobacter sp.]
MNWARKISLAGLILIGLGSVPSFAQGCAMCRANAKATPKEAQRAINRAIFVMLAPPLGIMSLGAGFVARYARKRDKEKDTDND